MCTNRALTDLYAFSARFIQLLNRKLAYVCIADYYLSLIHISEPTRH